MNPNPLVRAARAGEFLLGALFLSAAVLKLANVPLFASQILSYGVISSPQLVVFTAYLVLPLEVILGVAMLAALRVQGYVFLASIAMLVFFSGLVWYAWPENCGCFGPIKMGPEETLTKNVIMFALAALGWLTLRKQPETEPNFGSLSKWAITLALGGLSLYFTYDQLSNPDKYFGNEKPKSRATTPPVEPAKVDVPAPVATTTPTPTPEATPPAQPPTTPPPPAATEGEQFATAPTGTEDYPADAPAIYAGYTVTAADGTALDLGVGTYFVAALSATCEHCMATVPAINDLTLRPDLPTVVAIMHEPEAGSVDDFVAQTAASFPMLSVGNDFLKFSSFIKTKPPRFTLVKDGRPVKSWEEYPPTAEEILAAMAPPAATPTP